MGCESAVSVLMLPLPWLSASVSVAGLGGWSETGNGARVPWLRDLQVCSSAGLCYVRTYSWHGCVLRAYYARWPLRSWASTSTKNGWRWIQLLGVELPSSCRLFSSFYRKIRLRNPVSAWARSVSRNTLRSHTYVTSTKNLEFVTPLSLSRSCNLCYTHATSVALTQPLMH